MMMIKVCILSSDEHELFKLFSVGWWLGQKFGSLNFPNTNSPKSLTEVRPNWHSPNLNSHAQASLDYLTVKKTEFWRLFKIWSSKFGKISLNEHFSKFEFDEDMYKPTRSILSRPNPSFKHIPASAHLQHGYDQFYEPDWHLYVDLSDRDIFKKMLCCSSGAPVASLLLTQS